MTLDTIQALFTLGVLVFWLLMLAFPRAFFKSGNEP